MDAVDGTQLGEADALEMITLGQRRGIGLPGGGPQKVGVAVADLFTGLYATVAILAALAAALDDEKLADVLEELPEDDRVEIVAGTTGLTGHGSALGGGPRAAEE